MKRKRKSRRALIEERERWQLGWLRSLAAAGITRGFGRMTVADRKRLPRRVLAAAGARDGGVGSGDVPRTSLTPEEARSVAAAALAAYPGYRDGMRAGGRKAMGRGAYVAWRLAAAEREKNGRDRYGNPLRRVRDPGGDVGRYTHKRAAGWIIPVSK